MRHFIIFFRVSYADLVMNGPLTVETDGNFPSDIEIRQFITDRFVNENSPPYIFYEGELNNISDNIIMYSIQELNQKDFNDFTAAPIQQHGTVSSN